MSRAGDDHGRERTQGDVRYLGPRTHERRTL